MLLSNMPCAIGYLSARLNIRSCLLGWFLLWLGGCASPAARDGISEQTTYPQETDNFYLVESQVNKNPFHGIHLSYIDKKYQDDLIDVHIYPIAEFQWEYSEARLRRELGYIMDEIDRSIAVNEKSFRSAPQYRSFQIDDDAVRGGLRCHFVLTNAHGRQFDTFVYLFMVKDKYIKFQTIFDAQLSPGWNGDTVVEELFPHIHVANESAFVKKQRRRAKKEYRKIVQGISEQD